MIPIKISTPRSNSTFIKANLTALWSSLLLFQSDGWTNGLLETIVETLRSSKSRTVLILCHFIRFEFKLTTKAIE